MKNDIIKISEDTIATFKKIAPFVKDEGYDDKHILDTLLKVNEDLKSKPQNEAFIAHSILVDYGIIKQIEAIANLKISNTKNKDVRDDVLAVFIERFELKHANN